MNFLQRIKLNLYDDREIRRLVAEGEYKFEKQPKYILDLGAHKGFATTHFAKKYKNAQIHAYEPNQKLFSILRRRVKRYPHVTVFNEAISDHDGTVSFTITERNVSSMIGSGVKVPCVSLKTAISRIGIPVSIKMDIEGAEFDALKDTHGILEITGELHPQKAGRKNEEIRQVLSSFASVTIQGSGKCLFHAV